MLPPRCPSPGRHRPPRLVGLLPAALLGLVLLGFAVRDIFVAKARASGRSDDRTRASFSTFHDGNKKDELDKLVPEQTDALRPDHGSEKGGETKRLTFDDWGRTNNTCVRLDGEERLFGERAGAGSGGPAAGRSGTEAMERRRRQDHDRHEVGLGLGRQEGPGHADRGGRAAAS